MGRLKTDKKIRKASDALAAFEVAYMDHINALKQIKSQLTTLRQTMTTDNDFKTEDETDVQDTLDAMAAEILTI